MYEYEKLFWYTLAPSRVQYAKHHIMIQILNKIIENRCRFWEARQGKTGEDVLTQFPSNAVQPYTKRFQLVVSRCVYIEEARAWKCCPRGSHLQKYTFCVNLSVFMRVNLKLGLRAV